MDDLYRFNLVRTACPRIHTALVRLVFQFIVEDWDVLLSWPCAATYSWSPDTPISKWTGCTFNAGMLVELSLPAWERAPRSLARLVNIALLTRGGAFILKLPGPWEQYTLDQVCV